MHDELLTPSQAGKIMHLHPSTIIRWILQGKLRYKKPGKRYLVFKSDIDELMETKVAPGTPSEARNRRAEADEILRKFGVID